MAGNTELDSRFDKLDAKIDKLAEALIDLVRAEERLIGLQQLFDNMFERQNRMSRNIDVIEKKVQENQVVINTIKRIGWLIVGGIVTVGTAAVIILVA